MICFYSEDLKGEIAQLEADEFHHCCKVLRHKVGDVLNLMDGKGTLATAELHDIRKHTAELKIISRKVHPAPTTQIHLCVAPPKTRARWEWLVEKTVELGVSKLTALITHRTERSKLNADRTAKIMRSAAMQSLQTHHPTFEGTLSFDKLLQEKLAADTDMYLAHYMEGQQHLAQLKRPSDSALILVGPEGDFSQEEMDRCNDMGFICVNISEHRLRTETAAMTAIALLKAIGY